MYESSRFVVHAGAVRSIEPFKGRVKSRLKIHKRLSGLACGWQLYVHDINSRPTECFHASVVVQRRIHAIYTDSVDSELLEVGQVTLTCGSIGEGVDESARLRERGIGVHSSSTWRGITFFTCKKSPEKSRTYPALDMRHP
jgi:hypothetical protein